jgi:Trypsin-co-occurring domain 1
VDVRFLTNAKCIVLCLRASEGMMTVASQIVRYQVDGSTEARFEIDPGPGWHPAGPSDLAGKVREAVGPAVEAAKAVLDKIKETKPDGIQMKFGVKVNGEASWVVAKAATEGSFEVTLTWNQRDEQPVTDAAD